MAKTALLILALVAAATAAPQPMGIGIGGVGVVAKNTHITTGVMSPYMGYGMLAYPGVGLGHSIATQSVSHAAVPHLGIEGMGGGMGMMGLKGLGMYPGGVGLGYGLMG